MFRLVGRIVLMSVLTVIAMAVGAPYTKDAKRRRARHRPLDVLDGPYHLRG